MSVYFQSCLSPCLYDFRSPHNYKLYVVAEEHSALKESLDHLQLFSEDNLHRGGPVRLGFTATCIYALLTKHEVKMAGYWPSSFFAFLRTEMKSSP